MIKLPNGDFLITDYTDQHFIKLVSTDSSKKLSIKYIEDNKLYNTDYKKFVENVLAHYLDYGYDERGDYKYPFLMPRKLTDEFSGYWDGNFDFMDEIFSQIGKIKYYCWGKVFESPWKIIYIQWIGTDSGGYDSEMRYKKFENLTEWENYCIVGENRL